MQSRADAPRPFSTTAAVGKRFDGFIFNSPALARMPGPQKERLTNHLAKSVAANTTAAATSASHAFSVTATGGGDHDDWVEFVNEFTHSPFGSYECSARCWLFNPVEVLAWSLKIDPHLSADEYFKAHPEILTKAAKDAGGKVMSSFEISAFAQGLFDPSKLDTHELSRLSEMLAAALLRSSVNLLHTDESPAGC